MIKLQELEKDVKYVKGVGPNRVELLNKIGIRSLGDLITYYPRDYEDRGKVKKIYEIINGEECLIDGIVVSKILELKTSRRNMTMYKLKVKDETGTCTITWFNKSYLKTIFKIGDRYSFFGKVKIVNGKYEMSEPSFDKEGKINNTGRIIPIYPLTYNLSQNTIRKIIENGLKELDFKLTETLPEYIIKQNKLCELNYAINKIHFPDNYEEYKEARRRLVFEELLELQLLLLSIKNNNIEEKIGIKFSKDIRISKIVDKLPFSLTKAQIRVLNEIEKDMESNKCMNRLLQGDVGSGKTIVSILAAYKAVKSGYQAAIMAPTSILASQHLESFTSILSEYNINCELLIGSTTAKNKKIILEKLRNGEIDIIIGTHALIEENVEFKNLGLVVTDEQHRFGVKQRNILSEKGNNPDVIVMSATPIPRTLALILYGDLDISIIDELPPNRKQIETYAVTKNMEERINNFINKNLKEGRQAYIVCPLVEESEDINAEAVMSIVEKYKSIFSEFNVEYIYGKMKAKEKDRIMEEFKDGKINVLISTTVIEVGVNVPNANIMVIESAQRFGLATLHQLRGRVGRGEYQSYCILKYEGNSELTKKRMEVISSTTDGFVISEKDLELRGAGDFFGTRQHGLPEFKIANLFEDMPILKEVQKVANMIIKDDKLLEKEENKKLKEMCERKRTMINVL